MLAERGGFEPDRARSVKKTRRWRVFSGARSALAADRVNFERSSKFGHPPPKSKSSIPDSQSGPPNRPGSRRLSPTATSPHSKRPQPEPYLFSSTLVTSTFETRTKCSSFSRRSSLAHHMRIRRMMPPAMKSETGSKRSNPSSPAESSEA